MKNDYILSTADDEQYRMKLLENEFDALTHRRLKGCPIKEGDYCLEIGPGAGSIARWMSTQVKEKGKVIAIDKHPKHFSSNGHNNIELLHADITASDIQKQFKKYFNIIHTRFVLVHIANSEHLIAQLVTMLKPGGWLVLEEPDFTTTVALEDGDNSHKTLTALQKLIMHHGESAAFARRLPYLFQELHLSNIQAEGYVPISPGMSHLTEMHSRTVKHLANTLLAAQLVTQDTLDQFFTHCNDPKAWTRECQIICISGQYRKNLPKLRSVHSAHSAAAWTQ